MLGVVVLRQSSDLLVLCACGGRETFGGRGAGKLQFEFDSDMSCGGWICFAEPDCILVAEFGNGRVQLVGRLVLGLVEGPTAHLLAPPLSPSLQRGGPPPPAAAETGNRWLR